MEDGPAGGGREDGRLAVTIMTMGAMAIDWRLAGCQARCCAQSLHHLTSAFRKSTQKYHPHSTGKKSEAWRSQVTRSRPQNSAEQTGENLTRVFPEAKCGGHQCFQQTSPSAALLGVHHLGVAAWHAEARGMWREVVSVTSSWSFWEAVWNSPKVFFCLPQMPVTLPCACSGALLGNSSECSPQPGCGGQIRTA